MNIDDIHIGDRVRKDMGDIESLARSIQEHGLLHPVVVTSERQLVCGARRIAAARLLKWGEIPVREVNVNDLLTAERDENTVRKNLLPTEAVAIGRLIEERERASRPSRSELNRASNQVSKLKKSDKGDSPSSVSLARGPVAGIASSAVGMPLTTYTHARDVVESAEHEPEKYGDLPAKMDATGSVYPVYSELRKRRNGAAVDRIIPKTRTFRSRRGVAERARHAIGVIVSMSSEFDDFSIAQLDPADNEAKEWESELASAVSSLNRFRRRLKGRNR